MEEIALFTRLFRQLELLFDCRFGFQILLSDILSTVATERNVDAILRIAYVARLPQTRTTFPTELLVTRIRRAAGFTCDSVSRRCRQWFGCHLLFRLASGRPVRDGGYHLELERVDSGMLKVNLNFSS